MGEERFAGDSLSVMAEDDIDQFLISQGHGVLSLTDQANTYSVPMSFGYDGEVLYFQFATYEDSRKMAYLESTDTASFVTYDVESAHDWASVLVRGSIERTGEEDEQHGFQTLADNAVFTGLEVFGSQLEEVSFEVRGLVPSERHGLKGSEYE